jgi:CRP-like cAMP-binding protein
VVITTKEKKMNCYENYFGILKKTGLFTNINNDDLSILFNCMEAMTHNVRKGQFVILEGDKLEYIGIVLSGQLNIIREYYNGSRSLLAAVTPGGVFAEALCCAGVAESPVTVTADADSSVMLLDFSRILHTCRNSCSFHTKLIENMLSLIAKKNIMLQTRMELVSLKSVRTKVLRYLESFAPIQGKEIAIPFNREEMADFLCVERSALSHELSRMKRDGLIEYRKNIFILLGF